MADYSVTGDLSITVPANATQATKVLKLTPTLDGRKEARTETVLFLGAANNAGEFFVRPEEFQIIDAPVIELSVNPTSVSENGGQQNVVVTAEVGDPNDTPFAHDVVVNLLFLAGSGTDAAIPGRDFVQPAASLTLPANQRSATATVALTPTDDNLFEGPEKIRVTGTTQSVEIFGTDLTLTDNETVPDVVLSLSDDVLLESDAAGTAVTVTATLRTAELTDDVLVTLDLGGSATEGSAADYTAAWTPSTKQIRIPSGQLTRDAMVTLSPLQDDSAEGTETIVFEGTATRVTAGTALVMQVATAQLRDDDVRGVIAKPATLTLQEGGSGSVALRLATEPTGDVTVALSAPQGQGVTLDKSDLTFSPSTWETEQSVTVSTQSDNLVNPMGKRELEIALVVSGADYQGHEADPVDLVLIDADSAPVLSTADASASEGEAVTFTVVRLGVTSAAVTVAYATADDTAVAATDYTAVSGTLTFAAGETMKTITVQTTEDAVNEETEVFKLRLSNPTGGASIASGSEEVEGTINDDEAPTVQIGGVPAKINSTTALTATFTFSEDVTGFATGDVTVTGGTKGTFAGSGKTYTLAVTPSDGENVVVTVAANAATDGLNTGPAAAVSATAMWDAAAPTVAIGGVPPKINSTAALSVTFTFSEDVTGFVTGDVTVTGGTKGAFASTNARTYTLAVTPTDGENVVVTVAANSATDGVNTGPASAVSATATWDEAAPTVQIGGVPTTINSTAALSVTFTFSEDVTGFATGDVTVTGGTKGAFASTSARVYTLVVTPTSGSNVMVTVAANSATDGLNTGPAAAVSATATWDAAAPAVEIGGVPAKINSTAVLSVTFTFSEDVTGFATGDVTVTGGTKGAFASTNARTYTLAVTPTSGSNVVVTVAANSATDGLNTGPASAVSATATWDAAAPTVGITGVPPKINSTAALTATFTFSEDVTGFATGDVTVTGGAKGAFASTSARVYTLAVTPTSGSNVVVTVAANSASDGLNTGPASAVSATATWDAVAPTVGITGVPPKINSTTALTATFTFSEDVTGFATGDVTVTGGAKGAFASTSARVYTLAVTPTSGSNVVVTVAANSASDGLNTGPASAVSATATWDAAAPTVAITGVPSKINSTTAFTATFTFSEDVTGFVTGDVTVTGGTKGTFTAVSGTTYRLVVTPTNGSNVTITVAANSATDGLNTGPAAAVSAMATWDAAVPTVTIGGVPSKINSTSPLSVTFTFSEDVTGFETGDVTVTGGTKGTFASTSARVYTLAVTPTSGSNVVVTVAANSATDGLNTGPASAVSETATWDAVAPTVTIGGVPAKINSTSPLSVTFTFSEDVTGFVTGDVMVDGGTKGAFAGSGRTYTLAVTPTSGSHVTVTVAANAATDGVNTGPAAAVSETATWDAAAPTVTIGGVPAKINSTTALSVTFTFSEDVTGFATGDVTVTGGTKGTFAGSGKTYTLPVTPAGSADVTVTVAANAATDGVNTGPTAAVSATATWDAAAPTVTIGGVPAKINSTTVLSVTFTFSEDVTGFATGDVTVTGATKGAFAGSGKTYTLAVTPSGSADVVITVAANSATDGLNTGPTAAVSATATWDAAAPAVEISGVPPKINSTTALTATFTFSEDVTEFVTGDVTVTGATKGTFAGSGKTYTLAVTPTGGSNVVVTVAANSASDGVNTGPAAAVSATATWDVAAPTVAITGVPPKINSTTALSVTFTFSEDVTGFATGDVTVTGATKGTFAGSGKTYTLAVTPTGGSNVVVTVAANSASDGVNTGPAAAVSATATWDAVAPTVAITGVPPRFNSTNQFTATFTFSEDVTGFATGDVTVTGATKGAFASTNARTYTLAVTPTGGSNVVVTVAANSATDGVNTGPAAAVSATATWDGAAPAVEITGVPAKINSTTALSVTFTFSEDVTGFATGDVTVTGGTKGAFASTSARVYTLAVTPTNGSNVMVTVTANSATDGVNTGPAVAVSATATWDGAAPAVEITGVPAKINSTTALSVTFTFSEDVTGFATGDVNVTGGTKGAFTGTGRVYTLAVTPTSGSDVTVTVAANSATDGLNTGPTAAVSATATWDAAVPTVEITGVPPRINSTNQFTATFTFSEDVTGFATGDVTVTGGTKGAFAGTGTVYTLAVTPTSGSDVTVTVAANSATDGLNTGPTAAVSATATWDAAAPAVEIGGVPPKINSTAVLSTTFTFSKDVTGFATGDVTVTGGTKGAFAGSGRTYTLAVTPTDGSDVVVTVAANSATDGLNTGPTAAVSATATWDAAAPAVKISGVPPKINSTAVLSTTFTFSEDVTGFATGDVTVTGGTKGTFASTSATTYTLAVTPTSGSNVVVTVAANSATDGLNTGPASAVSATATWDAAAPAVEISGVPPKINSTAVLSTTFTFSEDVTGFVTGDVTVTGGTKGAFAGSGRTYTLAVTPTDGSDVVVTVTANAATDGTNTGPAAAVSATATWDATAPAVEIGGVPPKINSTAVLTATFTFSEDVTGFATGDVTVTGGTKGTFAGSGRTYTLAVTPTDGSDVVVTVAANAATDGLNTGPTAAVSATAMWDAAAPAVEISGVPPKINSTAVLTATFTFSEDVTGFATGDVTITGGTKGAFAGSGKTYTLAVTPTSGSNVVVTVAANSASDGVNTGPASAVSATATWDAAAPAIEIGGVPAKINSTAALGVTFTWSEAVTGFVTGDVTVTGGTKGAFTGSGTTYTLAVTPTDGSDVTVTVAASSATDGTNTGPAAAVSATATWDAAAPTVGITGVPTTINSTAALTATFSFSEAVTGFVTGDVTVTGGTKGTFTAVSGTTYTLAVTPTSGSNVVVTVAANSATDGLNTGPAAAVSATATWDAAAPAVEIGGVPAKINSTAVLSVTFTFSEDVTGFATGDVTVSGGTKGAFSGSGDTYTLAVTPTDGSNVVVTVVANAATDGLNTGPAAAVSKTAVWDAAAPAVEITGVPAKINSTTGFTATFTFSKDVTEFVTGGVTVSGGSKGAFTAVSATTYTLAVTPDGSADVVVTVTAGSATDGVNTGPATAVSKTAVWDADAPAVEITGVPDKINSTAQFTATFTFSEAVTEFVTSDVTVSGGSKGAFSGSGATYTLAVTPSGSADVVVTVTANSATDGLNTGPASAVSVTAVWDVATVTVGDASATEGNLLAFTVTLDQEVSGGLTVTPSFIDGTATKGIDYTENTAALSFAGTAGETRTFTVATTEDAQVEGDEMFTVGVTVSGTTARVTATDTGTGTIIDGDTAGIVLSATTLGVDEGSAATYTVRLAGQPAVPVTVTITGHAGTDLTLNTASLRFTAETWNIVQPVTVAAARDDDAQDDEVTLVHTASQVPGYAGERASLLVLVAEPQQQQFALADASSAEGRPVVFALTRLNAADAASVPWSALEDPGAEHPATAGEDFEAASGTVEFASGQASATISVATVRDEREEPSETFAVEVYVPSGEPLRATGTIRDATERSRGPSRGVPALALWTDALAYLSGDSLRLYLDLDPRGEERDHAVFVSLVSVTTGERVWLDLRGERAGFEPDVVDMHGRAEERQWARPLARVDKRLVWEGAVPAPGLWHFVAELRSPTTWQVLKRAYAKFVVAGAGHALVAKRGFERRLRHDERWSNDTLRALLGRLVVPRGVTLEIEAGTHLRAWGPEARIVVEAGGRIVARGRREAPIVLTCAGPVGQREPGCWGGLELYGEAGLGADAEAGNATEGAGLGPGSAAHSSGELRYVRVEFAGGGPDGPGAALRLHGVGSGTVLENVQVHASQGNGFEFREGRASCRRCVASDSAHSGVSWDGGWQGWAQQVYVQQLGRDSHGLLGRGGPQSRSSGPVLYNVTLVGGRYGLARQRGSAIRLEGGAVLTARNVVATDFRGHGLSATGAAAEHLASGASSVSNAIFHLNGAGLATPNVEPYVRNIVQLPRLLNVRREPNPDPRPRSGSSALVPDHAAVPAFGGGLSRETAYLGAFGGQNWLEEWTWFGGEEQYRATE